MADGMDTAVQSPHDSLDHALEDADGQDMPPARRKTKRNRSESSELTTLEPSPKRQRVSSPLSADDKESNAVEGEGEENENGQEEEENEEEDNEDEENENGEDENENDDNDNENDEENENENGSDADAAGSSEEEEDIPLAALGRRPVGMPTNKRKGVKTIARPQISRVVASDDEDGEGDDELDGVANPATTPAGGKTGGKNPDGPGVPGMIQRGHVNQLVGERAHPVDEQTREKDRKRAVLDESLNISRCEPVSNDLTPRSSILLTGIKCLIQRGLPNMPRDYIARVVFDPNHRAVAVIKRGLRVVAAITFRPFESRGFAEIVFCAVDPSVQAKGYGRFVMDHLKDHVKAAYPNIQHFLTYADNFAVGYFKKQGFRKEITLEPEKWMGYIKDYESATIMQATMLPIIKYREADQMLKTQLDDIKEIIRQNTPEDKVYPGLDIFRNLKPGERVDPKDVPGLRETGWTFEQETVDRQPVKGELYFQMKEMLQLLQRQTESWPYLHPVTGVEGYEAAIRHPMDYQTMETKLTRNEYKTLSEFVADVKLIYTNAQTFNPENTVYYKNAKILEKVLERQLEQRNWVLEPEAA